MYGVETMPKIADTEQQFWFLVARCLVRHGKDDTTISAMPYFKTGEAEYDRSVNDALAEMLDVGDSPVATMLRINQEALIMLADRKTPDQIKARATELNTAGLPDEAIRNVLRGAYIEHTKGFAERVWGHLNK